MLPSAAGYLVCASLRSLPDERPLDVQQPSAVAKWFRNRRPFGSLLAGIKHEMNEV